MDGWMDRWMNGMEWDRMGWDGWMDVCIDG